MSKVTKLLDDMSIIANALAESKGPNLEYCPSIDLSLLPYAVAAISPDDCNGIVDDFSEDDWLKGLRFLSENDRIFPKTLQNAPLEEFVEYAKSHQDDILREVRETVESYYEEYIGVKFNS